MLRIHLGFLNEDNKAELELNNNLQLIAKYNLMLYLAILILLKPKSKAVFSSALN